MYEDYDEEMIEQISEKVNLIEYVSQELELEKRGDEYFAHCPKHVDKTPSLSFTESKNKYFCFSCGRGGGIINYLHQYEGLSYDEAIEKAAKLANMDIGCMCRSKTIIFLKKIRRNAETQKEKYVHQILDKSVLDRYVHEPVREWIDEGIKQDVMDKFGVMVDKIGNRIVYPVYDAEGNLINIKGRTRFSKYKEMKLPKYINYYDVGCMDYLQGLDVTKQNIKENKEIIIFESIKSVMKAYGWGYKNCVSAEKHSLTDEQIELLLKMKVDIVLAYDSDVSYNEKAVKKNIERLKRLTNLYVIDDRRCLLGGKEAKNAPVDCGKDVWEKLYNEKRRIR